MSRRVFSVARKRYNLFQNKIDLVIYLLVYHLFIYSSVGITEDSEY